MIACLDVRSNDQGDLVVTKGDQYDVREGGASNEVRNLGQAVELADRYFREGADEVTFLNITGFRDFPLGDMPMLKVVPPLQHTHTCSHAHAVMSPKCVLMSLPEVPSGVYPRSPSRVSLQGCLNLQLC